MAVLIVKGALPKRYKIKSIKIETNPCFSCGNTQEMELDYEKVMRWANGEHVQNIWPEMSADDRELLISGTCPKCWNEMFVGGK